MIKREQLKTLERMIFYCVTPENTEEQGAILDLYYDVRKAVDENEERGGHRECSIPVEAPEWEEPEEAKDEIQSAAKRGMSATEDPEWVERKKKISERLDATNAKTSRLAALSGLCQQTVMSLKTHKPARKNTWLAMEKALDAIEGTDD